MSFATRIVDMVKKKELDKNLALEQLKEFRDLSIKYPFLSVLTEEEYNEAKTEIEKLVI